MIRRSSRHFARDLDRVIEHDPDAEITITKGSAEDRFAITVTSEKIDASNFKSVVEKRRWWRR